MVRSVAAGVLLFLLGRVAPCQAPQEPRPEVPIPVDVEAERTGAPVRTLTLGDALRAGRSGNASLRAAAVLPEQARMELLFAEAGFVPELYANAGYAERESPQRNAFSPSVKTKTLSGEVGWRQRLVTGGLFDLAFAPQRFDSSGSAAFPGQQFTAEWTASYRQPLLRGGGTDYATAAINAARHRLLQSGQDFERAVQDTLLAVVEAYWELLFARENWRAVHSALAVAEEQLRITDERIRVQAQAPRDRIADEAEVARRREGLIVAENAIRAREDVLRTLLLDGSDPSAWRMNLRPTSAYAVEPVVPTAPFEELVDVAMQHRPDVRAQRSAIAAAEIAARRAESEALPALDLVGGYSSDGVRDEFARAWGDALDQQYPDWSVRLEFSLPLGNQAARSRAQQQALEVERQRRQFQALALAVAREVRDAVRSLQTLAQSIAAGRESVRLAGANLETEQVKLRVGASTAFEVQRRNQELLDARTRLLRNQLDYRAAESRLLHAQGLLRADGP
jgi:outer membrane protein TolC